MSIFLLPDLDIIGIFTAFFTFLSAGSFLGFFLMTNKYVEYVNVTYINKKYIYSLYLPKLIVCLHLDVSELQL